MGLGYSAMVWLVDNMAVDDPVIKTLQFVSVVSSTACPGIFCTTVQKERSTCKGSTGSKMILRPVELSRRTLNS